MVTVLLFVVAAAVVGGSVLATAITSLRLAHRNDMRAKMTTVADSELEWLFFNVKMAVMSGTSMGNLASSTRLNTQADLTATPTTVRDPFLDTHRTEGWRVQRSVRHLLTTTGIDTSNGGSRRALLDYVEAKVVVLPPASGTYAALPTVRIGRYFVASQSTIFQYGIFFNGDLELNPGENYSIEGDVYASGDAFVGPVSGKTMTIGPISKWRLPNGKRMNGTDDPEAVGTTRYNDAAPPPPVTFDAPIFGSTGTGRPSGQLEFLTKEENLLGGLDALATAKARPDLFGPAGKGDSSLFPPDNWTEAEADLAVNNVIRSLIVPPPGSASTQEYPNNPSAGDDPAISVQRAYNRAGLIVNVAANGAVTVSKRSSSGSLTDATSEFQGSLSLGTLLVPAIASSSPTNVFDAREGRNVKVTDLNVAALKSRIANSYSDFNGLVYVNLLNSTSSAPAAVRVINGEDVPTTAGGTGLSIATNSGLYVKGSYNTKAKADGTFPTSMLMADAITVLSYDWSDSNAAADVVTGRVAGVDNPATADNPLTLTINENIVETEIAINAGLITGNSPSNATNSSGGAQNLIRFLENWSGKNVVMNGSLGRVFQSTHFTRPFIGTSTVYRAPNRTVIYDPNLASAPPAGSPILTGFSRGDVFRF